MTAGRERGGAAILVAFLLLTLMAGAVLATGRNVLRELAAAAEAGPAAGAEAAAESGLDWFLAWAGAEPGALRALLEPLEAGQPGARAELAAPDWAGPGEPLDQAFRVTVQRLGAWPGTAEQAWRVTSAGTCRPRGSGPVPPFRQVRELICTTPEGDPWTVRVLARRAPAAESD